jgi:hypothetical protein
VGGVNYTNKSVYKQGTIFHLPSVAFKRSKNEHINVASKTSGRAVEKAGNAQNNISNYGMFPWSSKEAPVACQFQAISSAYMGYVHFCIRNIFVIVTTEVKS